jgi:hypothetical protein
MKFYRAKIILIVTILSTGLNTNSTSGVGINPSVQSIEKSSCLTSQSLSEMYSLIDLIEKNYPNDLEETKPIKNKLNLAIQECEVSKDKKLDIDRLKELIVEATNLVLKLQKNNNGVSQISKFNLETSSDRTTGYSRASFKHWIDSDKDGCNTRAEVLIEEAVVKPKVGSKCKLTGGEWISAYDGKRVSNASQLDVDHLVPLAEAWRSGAWKWSSAKRQAYANDLDDARALIAVTLSSNRSKGDKDPALWMPVKEQCAYAENWIAIKIKYSLTVDINEAMKLNSLIDSCGLGD